MDKCFFGTSFFHRCTLRPRVLVRSKIIYRCTMTRATTTRSSLRHFLKIILPQKISDTLAWRPSFISVPHWVQQLHVPRYSRQTVLLSPDCIFFRRLFHTFFIHLCCYGHRPHAPRFFPRVCLAHQCVPKRLNQSI